MFDKLVLDVSAWLIGTIFAFGGTVGHGRATHRYGVGAAGTARIVPNPQFPAHPFFRPGAEFPVQIRHATVTFPDDATLDVRSGSLKFSHNPAEAPLDLVMNSGETIAFWNIPSFFAASKAVRGGERGGRILVETSPDAAAGTLDSVRRAPDSFTQITTFSKVCLGFTGLDGIPRLVKFRLLPEDRGPDQGIPGPQDRATPWKQARFENETRPVDYLRTEFLQRFKDGKTITRHLQLQLHHPVPPSGSDYIYNGAQRWDPETHPWMDLATVTLTRALTLEEVEGLQFRVSRLPEGMNIPPANSIHDYTSLAYVRSRVYPRAQGWRLRAYAARDQVGPRDYPAAIETNRVVQEAVGRLVHADAAGAPLHHVRVELIDRDVGGADALGEAVTDTDGRFRIRFNPPAAGRGDRADLALQVVALEAYRDADGADQQRRTVVFTLPGPNDFQGALWDAGEIRISWWEYDTTARFARAALVDGKPPQAFAPGTEEGFVKEVAGIAVTRAAHLAVSAVDPTRPSLHHIQEAYPTNLTQQLGAESRSDAFFGERMLNGFHPVLFEQDPDAAGGLRYRVDDSGYESNAARDLPLVDARFAIVDGKLLPTRITLAFRVPGQTAAGSPNGPAVTYTPADGERWLEAKRVVRCAWLVDGEVGAHLGGSHLNVEQYAVAAWRNLRKSPLRLLLFPHLQAVVTINRLGDDIIFGPSGILTANSPLTPASVTQRIVDRLATLDWRTFSPRQPVCPNDRFARSAQLYWDVLRLYVDGFFARHGTAIEREWLEIRRFSDDLVGHSVPYQSVARETFRGTPELDDPHALPARRKLGDQLHAVRPVTDTDTPAAGEMDLLKQLSMYAIYFSTFFHTWANDHQAEDGGEVLYCSHSLRNGSMAPEADLDIALLPAEATRQLFFAHSLSARTRGHILANEDGDIPPELGQLLAERRAAFYELGVDIERIRSRVNI
jgi:hypothetical protein